MADSQHKGLIQLLNSPGTLVALVGASENPSKYGSIIYLNLKDKGIEIIPINPHREEVHGDKAYASLASLPNKPDVVNIVTPPQVTLKVLEECLSLGLFDVWLQPGASDKEVRRFLKENGFNYLINRCTMAESDHL
jgi:predicted CoA-binding protein